MATEQCKSGDAAYSGSSKAAVLELTSSDNGWESDVPEENDHEERDLTPIALLWFDWLDISIF